MFTFIYLTFYFLSSARTASIPGHSRLLDAGHNRIKITLKGKDAAATAATAAAAADDDDDDDDDNDNDDGNDDGHYL